MYHSCSPDSNKEVVFQSLRQYDGVCRVVFATDALGMGIDVKGLSRVIPIMEPLIWGPTCRKLEDMEEMENKATPNCFIMDTSLGILTS
jgi:hypothetical protein